MMHTRPPFFYDLSEIFYAAAGRRKIYGVLRVIAELGLELQRMERGIQFVVYSPGHRQFFELTPDFNHLYDGDGIELGIPAAATPRLLRSVFHRYVIARTVGYCVAAPLVRAINRSRWQQAGVRCQTADLSNAILCSVARPKFLVEYLATLRRSRTRLVPMLHDLIPLHDSAHTSARANFCGDTSAVITAAAGVLANSAFTAAEIQHFATEGLLPTPARLSTVPLAHEFRRSMASASHQAPASRYFLCVGAARGRKNLDVVFDAFRLLHQSGAAAAADCSLVLAGAPSRQLRDYLARPEMAPVAAKVIFRHNPDHAELGALYQGAHAVLMPSKMEGWGLPAGEALWLGTPLICARVPALLEASAGLGLVFDPTSAAELAALIERVTGDPAFHAGQLAAVRNSQQHLRSWAQVAADLYQAVIRIAAHAPAQPAPKY